MKKFIQWLCLTFLTSVMILGFFYFASSFPTGDWAIRNWTIVRMVVFSVFVGAGMGYFDYVRKS